MSDPNHTTNRATRRALTRSADERHALYTGAFWIDLSERVVTSAAGGALAVATASTFVLHDVASWGALGAGAGVAALVSLLKGIAASSVGTGSASLTRSV